MSSYYSAGIFISHADPDDALMKQEKIPINYKNISELALYYLNCGPLGLFVKNQLVFSPWSDPNEPNYRCGENWAYPLLIAAWC